MPRTVSVNELTDLVTRVFRRHGVSAENAGPVAETVVAAERDGAASHGLLRLPGYVLTLRSGWVDGGAVPVVTDAAPGLVTTEAANGFAHAAVAIRNSHHFAAVWPDIEGEIAAAAGLSQLVFPADAGWRPRDRPRRAPSPQQARI